MDLVTILANISIKTAIFMDWVIILMCVSTKRALFMDMKRGTTFKRLSLIKICRYAAATSLPVLTERR